MLAPIFGPALGAGIVISLQDMLDDKVGAWGTVIIGAIFVVCVVAFRKGADGDSPFFESNWHGKRDRRR